MNTLNMYITGSQFKGLFFCMYSFLSTITMKKNSDRGDGNRMSEQIKCGLEAIGTNNECEELKS